MPKREKQMAVEKSKKEEANEQRRMVRAQINRRYIDASLLNISVIGGVVYLTGVIKALRTHPDVNLKEEMETISKVLRQSGMRDVTWDVNLRT